MRTCLPCPAGERWRIRRRRRYGHSVEATVGRSFRTPAATPSPWRGLPARARRHVRGVGFSSDVLLANLETHRVVGSPAAVVAQLGVALRREPGCDAGAVEAAAEALADRLTRAGSKHRGAAAPVTEQVPARALRALPGWTISTTDRASSPRPPPPFPKSSHPAATRAPRPVAAPTRERQPVRLQVVADQAGSKHAGESCNRGKGGQPVWPITPPEPSRAWRYAPLAARRACSAPVAQPL